MENKLVAVFNILIKEGYNFLTIRKGIHYRHYQLVNQRTSCTVTVREDKIHISLALFEDYFGSKYAERDIEIKSWDDLPSARTIIALFEDWYDEDVYQYEE
jgi:hypothetical protein